MGLFDKYKKSNINESVDWEKSMDGNDNNLDRIKRLKNLQVDVSPVMGDALEDDEKFDKNSKEVFTKLAKDAKDIIPENPGTGKKVTIKPYTEKLTLDESLFKESWNAKGSFENQSVKSVTYDEDDIPEVAYELMNWYGEYFEGWEGPDIEDALYGLDGERIPGSSCPIVFTMEEDEEDDWDEDDEEYDESLSNINEDYNVREYSDQLYDMIEDNMVNAKKVAEDLIYWCSEDDVEEYMRVNDLILDDEEYDESLKEAKIKKPKFWNSMFTTKVIDAYKNGKLTLDNIDEWEKEYNGGTKPTNLGTKEILAYYMNTGKDPRNESLEKKSLEDLNLLEYVNEEDVEDDEYTVYDLLNDRLFGYGINKSNFRVKWKFAEIEPTVKTRDGKLKRGYFYPTIHQDELVTGKSDDRRAFTEDGIGVFVHDEDEASLVKKCAEELDLDFVMKKLVRPHNGFNYIATIKVSDDIQEMPIKDYMESIGKSMSDILRGKGDKIKSNFKDSKNYQSRKTNKEQQETAE